MAWAYIIFLGLIAFLLFLISQRIGLILMELKWARVFLHDVKVSNESIDATGGDVFRKLIALESQLLAIRDSQDSLRNNGVAIAIELERLAKELPNNQWQAIHHLSGIHDSVLETQNSLVRHQIELVDILTGREPD